MRISGVSGPIAAIGLAVILAACSSGTGDGTAATRAAPTGPVTLNFWCWSAGQKDKVAAFNKAHPDIQVKHTDAGGGTDTAPSCSPRAGRATPPTPPAWSTRPSPP
ncbi:hypothetical protein [Nonomuraea rubra]|uniref:ABC-type glycerol-3-phosphate transport system substrate-binding protein n=1 Tax=Nonomuraea rubra TaxID=46180 RepID=A0A7X0NYJ7_9ACTN|nr:hypothetical protein [Nonomuraea rubra]MBB6551997.1 ABC-type glycerol-3-phosphate transport system substrate-binding protein [Nonomuraea rubra]